jgi:hypothetical protein
MRPIIGFMMLAFFALTCTALVSKSTAADSDKEKGKGSVVDLDGLRSTAPGDWKEQAPSNRMRFMQFVLPKKGDDKEDAELVIFRGLGGGAKANIERWKEQFMPAAGDVREIKIGDRPASYFDAQGTYLHNPQPFNPRSKKEPKASYRMLAIYFDGPRDVYQIKLTGPAKTVADYKKGFDDWLQNFK